MLDRGAGGARLPPPLDFGARLRYSESERIRHSIAAVAGR